VQDYVSPNDIIAEAPPPEPNAVLPLTDRYGLELTNGLAAATVLRIVSEDLYHFCISIEKLGMPAN
jgi:hypothetical protein